MKTFKSLILLAVLAAFLSSCNTTTVIVNPVEYNPEFYEGINSPDTIQILYNGAPNLRNN